MKYQDIEAPLFSIITVTFNSIIGLERTARSLYQQDRSLFEWIVIDGASTDGTFEKLEEFSNLVSYKISERDDGIYDAMNKGIRASKGRFLAFLNADDVFTANALRKIANEIRGKSHDKIKIIFGEAYLKLPNGRVRHRKILSPSAVIWHRLPTSHQATFIDREMHLQEEHDIQFPISSDYLTISRILQRLKDEDEILFIRSVISETPIGGNSYSNVNFGLMLFDHWRVQTKVHSVSFMWKLLACLRKILIHFYIKIHR